MISGCDNFDQEIPQINIMKRLLFIYNPASGRGTIKIHLDPLLEIFEDAGYLVDIMRIQGNFPEKERDLVAERGIKYDRVVCSGGDGTLNHVVSSIMKIPKEERPVIGFIPTGSTNDTGRSLDIPRVVEKAGRMVVEGEPFATDIGRLNDQFFTYVGCFGEISAVSAFTPQEAKKMFGRAAYIGEGIRAALRMKTNHLICRYDGKNKFEDDFLIGMISNSNSVGGFSGIMGKDIDLQDGRFEAAFVKKPANLVELNMIMDCLFISKKDAISEKGPLVRRFKASEMEIFSGEDIQWVKDGEDAGRIKNVKIVNENRAVRIITGPKLYDEADAGQ